MLQPTISPPRSLGALGLTEEHILSRKEATAFVRSLGDAIYVYILWRRFRDYVEPFYVGKGRRYRAFQHDTITVDPKRRNPLKEAVIQRCRATGNPVEYTIWKHGLDDPNAQKEEKRLITLIGRRSHRKGPLTNLTNGGDGADEGANHGLARAVVCDGKRYDWILAAATELGMSGSAIGYRIRVGWPGYYYEDEGQRSKPTKRPVNRKSAKRRVRRMEPVVVNGVRYATFVDAAAAIGLETSTIRYRCGHSEHPEFRYENADSQAKAEEVYRRKLERRTNPVFVDGVVFPNFREAMKVVRAQGREVLEITTGPAKD